MNPNHANALLTEAYFALHFNLGSFEGFNFRQNGAIDHRLTADTVVNWDHDTSGEAEFWPAGDHPGVALLFARQTSVTARQLLDLDRLLFDLGDDSTLNFLRIHHARNGCGRDLSLLTAPEIEDLPIQVFQGTSFLDLRRQAAFELFELHFLEEYRVWEKSVCDGLHFDPDRFLNSPAWSVEEIELNGSKALIVAAQ